MLSGKPCSGWAIKYHIPDSNGLHNMSDVVQYVPDPLVYYHRVYCDDGRWYCFPYARLVHADWVLQLDSDMRRRPKYRCRFYVPLVCGRVVVPIDQVIAKYHLPIRAVGKARPGRAGYHGKDVEWTGRPFPVASLPADAHRLSRRERQCDGELYGIPLPKPRWQRRW